MHHTLAIEALLQPPDRGGVYRVAPGNIGLCLACLQPGQGLLPLMWGELPRPAEADATLLRPLPALARPGTDQLALELGQPAPAPSASGAHAGSWCLPMRPSANGSPHRAWTPRLRRSGGHGLSAPSRSRCANGIAGSAAAPAARCKNLRRGSSSSPLRLPQVHSITSSASASSDGRCLAQRQLTRWSAA